MSPRALFRTFAFAELVTWAGLITALILRGTGVTDALVRPAGGVHGFVFLAYVVITVFVWVNQRWSAGAGMLGLVSAVIPFATLPYELVMDRKGKLQGVWRLAPGRDEPRGFVEHVQAWVLRHPFLAILILLLGVTAAFSLLLWMGPPVPRA
ncbi:DUF3817 domain-containing protein [Leucobacter chromiireducens]|uniref:DUF3817 domain-containing protein n=1 Tax=Leucobacter chromiireducens subsp. solipictus TaxID=398235 RepID=A0ABS1SIA4_9MICO|nr:DUF3817 domain-containing protein [Leucobacter chromiireducens]MBL3680288.1 DUF3817 domain-containing protein [Leucobacter chromiireducens subsp. solipictus]